MLELRRVSRSFDGKPAVKEIDLEIPGGRTTALIGPSGCGKSTLLRLLIGLLEPDAGEVRFDGEPVLAGDGAAQIAQRRRMGYVIQDGGLFPHLDARGNAALLARHLGWEASRVEARIAELCELTHFPTDGLDRFPGQLSGGQRQRVSLMRALMLDPDVLLLDEPLGALDPMIRSDLQEDLRRVFGTLGKTVVLVTHDIGEAGYLADEIVLLRAGRIVQRGTLEALVRRPEDPFVSEFVRAQRSPLESLAGAESGA
jgi:osmoprotectant transport system ATP-binding protein